MRAAVWACLFLLACGVTSAQQVSTEAQITLTNSGSPQGIRTLTFGVHPGATLGIDAEYGEDAFPPFPPSAVFEARFVTNGESELGEGSPADIRPYVSAGQTDEYKVRLQAGTNGLPITITWDMDYLKAHYTSVALKDPFGGVILNVDMLATATATLDNAALTEVLIQATGPKDPSVGVHDGDGLQSLQLQLRRVPNPVQGEATISYTLAATAAVTLAVTDARGGTVARIIEQEVREAGNYREVFDTHSLAGGLYFISLEADGVLTTTPMMVVR